MSEPPDPKSETEPTADDASELPTEQESMTDTDEESEVGSGSADDDSGESPPEAKAAADAASPRASKKRHPATIGALALAVLGLAGGGYAGYLKYSRHRAEVHTTNLRLACERGERAPCSELCQRLPADISACLRLGTVLSKLDDSPRDLSRSVELFQKACSAGNSDGCARLGRAQYNGTGTKRDHERARGNLDRACQEGNALGCAGFGHLLLHGQGGLKRDAKRAVGLFRKA